MVTIPLTVTGGRQGIFAAYSAPVTGSVFKVDRYILLAQIVRSFISWSKATWIAALIGTASSKTTRSGKLAATEGLRGAGGTPLPSGAFTEHLEKNIKNSREDRTIKMRLL